MKNKAVVIVLFFLYLMEIEVLTVFAMLVKIIPSAEFVNYKTVSLQQKYQNVFRQGLTWF